MLYANIKYNAYIILSRTQQLGFRDFFCEILLRFTFSLHKFLRKSLRNTNENFRIFSRNVLFAANPNNNTRHFA